MRGKGIIKNNKIAVSIIMGLFLILILSSTSILTYAEESSALDVTVSIKQSVIGVSNAEKEEGRYVVTGLGSMGLGLNENQSEEYTFCIMGNAEYILGPLTYTDAGIYEYKIEQRSDVKENMIFDDSVFTIIVAVKRNTNGVLGSEVYFKNAKGYKLERLEFVNKGVKAESDFEKNNSYANNSNQHGSAKTGDDTERLISIIVLLIVSSVLIILFAKRKIKDKYEN
ncbi:MAG: Spy0128 family protein [Suipraeoptans sp.]